MVVLDENLKPVRDLYMRMDHASHYIIKKKNILKKT